jgi:hypothetical protein
MFIHITPDEFVEEFRESWKLGYISQPSIDYATNAIHVWFEGRDCILFNFKDYGWFNDNRFNTYSMSSGPAGITIQITKTR